MHTVLASAYKELIRKRRYLANTIFNIVLFYIIFLALLGGVRLFAGTFDYGETLPGLIVGFYSWTMMLSVFTSTGYIIEENKMYGTIETITANSTGLMPVLIAEAAVSMMFYFVFSILNLFLFSITAGVTIAYNILSILSVVLIGLTSILGLSLVVAGATLIFRKASNALSIIQFVLLGFLFLSPSVYTKLAVPFFSASTLLRTIIIDDVSIINVPVPEVLYLIINAVVFMALGITCFLACFRYAKKKGILGFY